ncbi:MAG TPA: sensor histidine kinase [Chloroflexota bacterium]|nr:sensor histidine kinase [Chloroflexota bacterium]
MRRRLRALPAWAIRHELTLLVLATLLPFAVLGVFGAQEGYRAEQARIQSRALRLAHDVSGDVDQFIADTGALIEALARVPTIKRAEQPQADQLLTELVQRYPYYESLYVLDSAGRVVAAGGAELPPPGPRQSYVQEALTRGATITTDPLQSRTQRRHVFVVATPLWDEGGAPGGVIAASVNLLRLQEGLRRADLPANSSVLVVDASGRVVARRTDPEEWVGRDALFSGAVRDALRLREGVSEGDFVDGLRKLSGFSPTTRVPWEVIVGIPLDEAYGALRRELVGALARLALAAVAAGGAAWLLARRLTRPIGDLAAAARAFAEGDLARRAPVSGPDEVAALAQTLNRMAAALERQVAELRESRERERIASERALVELRRLHSEFIAVAAHELRTPVAAAKSYAELLLRHEDHEVSLPAATRRQSLARLDGVCDRLARLVRSLLGASRIQAGGLELERLPFDVTPLVRRVVDEIGAASPGHDVALRMRPRTAAIAVGDAERAEDVLVNLLVNATKYSPPGSNVFVDILEDDRWLEVAVSDEGPGVPVGERAAIFERFARGATRGGGSEGGVGLGLYIARAYVEAMGGSIGVRSGSGKGATFWFRLPRPAEADRGAPAPRDEGEDVRARDGRRSRAENETVAIRMAATR